MTFSVLAEPTMTKAEAFANGKASGNEASLQSSLADINATNGTDKVSGYSSSAAESTYWSRTATIATGLAGGSTKIAECSGAPSADPRIKNQCEAILALQHQPLIRPSNLITNTDPLIVRGRAITHDPELIAGNLGGLYSACTTRTESLGRAKVTESCDDYSALTTTPCSIGERIVVDADHLYKCLESVHVLANATCTVGKVVVVDADANYRCIDTALNENEKTCKRHNVPSINKAFKFHMGQACTPIAGVYCSPDNSGSNNMLAKFTAAWNMGYRNIMVDGEFVKTIASPLTRCNQYGTCDGPMKPSFYYQCDYVRFQWSQNSWDGEGFSRGHQISMCGQSQCASVTPIVTSDGIVGYTCTAVAAGVGCPSGFTDQGDNWCLSNTYSSYAGNAACSLVQTVATTIPGADQAYEYDFVCKTYDDQCTGYAARAL